jgi:hypothetical protein
VSDQEESEQTEPKYVILERDDDDYRGHPEGGWVDTDTKEEPMELPEDHPEVSSSSNEDPTGGDGADPGAASRDEDEDGDDDSNAADGSDDDPDDDPEVAVAASPPPPEQEEEWLVVVVISVPDERHGSRVEYSKHIVDVPRRTLDAGTSEAAKRALYYLCHAYRDELQGTEFPLFPRCKRGATCARIPAPPLGKEAYSSTLCRSWSPLSARTWMLPEQRSRRSRES